MASRRYGIRVESLGWVLVAGMLPEAGLAQTPASYASYYEFGRVAALGRGSIDVLTYDEARGRLVKHSYLLTRETRADRVQAGDTVEVIYGVSSAGLALRRLVLLTEFPVAGPPSATARASSDAKAAPTARPGTPAATARGVTLPTTSAPSSVSGERSVTLPTASAARTGSEERAVNLGRAENARPAEIVNVPLGVGAEASARIAQPKTIAHDTPSEECNRSALDWPKQPVSLAVLDFRYPTEREESHESGTTGGGSGTAVADLVFSRLEQNSEFALSRGDRQKLYRADFAGAARLGRQMGVDAVLAGTFVPIDGPPTADGFPGPRTWELRAGVVDTCTGQLLMRLYSQSCVDGAVPGQDANETQCRRLTVTAKQAMNPEMNVGAFQPPLDAMLAPLEHNTTPPEEQGTVGSVTGMSGGRLTLKLAPGASVRSGDELAIHATRLTKNPMTYTLQNLHDQEIGRMSITSVQGGVATGAFAGEIPPKAGDVAVNIAQP